MDLTHQINLPEAMAGPSGPIRSDPSPSGPSRLVPQNLDLTHYLDPQHADDPKQPDGQDSNKHTPAGQASLAPRFDDDPSEYPWYPAQITLLLRLTFHSFARYT